MKNHTVRCSSALYLNATVVKMRQMFVNHHLHWVPNPVWRAAQLKQSIIVYSDPNLTVWFCDTYQFGLANRPRVLNSDMLIIIISFLMYRRTLSNYTYLKAVTHFDKLFEESLYQKGPKCASLEQNISKSHDRRLHALCNSSFCKDLDECGLQANWHFIMA